MSAFRRLGVRVVGAALALLLVAPVTSAFAQADATVDMKNLQFAPIEIHIQPGQSVQWTNSDPLQHTVTADDGSFDSGLLDAGGTFSQSFDAPGSYQYFCQPHGSAGLHGMAATIVVDDPDAASGGDD